MITVIFIIIAIILLFIFIYRINTGENVYKFIVNNVNNVYEKYAPYSFKVVREKFKELGQEFTPKQYFIQIVVFSVGSAIVSYLYFYSLIWCIVYIIIAILIIPYLSYLRCKRLYSEFIFEQIQVYTTNTIMEFATTQSFVKSLEGVYESGILEDPVKSDVKTMIDMAYRNGTINESITFMNEKYDYYIVRNMHQLFLQITNEGSKNSGPALDNMSLDIDMLVENVYSDRLNRANFHKKFIQFGIGLYLMVMLVQLLLGDSYTNMLSELYMRLLLHAVLIINSFFLINGEKYYNENVGAE